MDLNTILLDELLLHFKKNPPAPGALFSVDGVCPGGRAIVARELARHIVPASLVAADTLATAAKLTAAIDAARQKGRVVVEGVMLRSRLSDIGIRPDAAVYVFPAPESGRREFFEGILSRSLNDMLSACADNRERDIVRYHHTFHPVIHADFLVQDKAEI